MYDISVISISPTCARTKVGEMLHDTPHMEHVRTLLAAWDVGVAVQDGRMFHGNCHLRVNLALPLSRVREAFDRLDKYVFNA